MINESKILELIKRHKETGLTITAFCRNEGIPKSSFYYWRKTVNRVNGKRFIPLLVNTTAVNLSEPSKSFAPDQHVHHTSSDPFPMEIRYPNGTTLRIKQNLDLAGLRSLVSLLD